MASEILSPKYISGTILPYAPLYENTDKEFIVKYHKDLISFLKSL